MHPFNFGSARQPLFGIYHAPTAARAAVEAVVICQPFGHEYIRAHRSIRNLAVRLSDSGCHVLRFDYFGCGDSAGDVRDATFAIWQANVASAIDELKEMSGATRISLAGVRFGATLALLSTVGRRDIDCVALWDPVESGTRYIEGILRLQERWLATRPRVVLPAGRKQGDELLGFPLSPTLRRDLEAIDLTRRADYAARRMVVINSLGMHTDALTEHLRATVPQVTHEAVADDCAWGQAGAVHNAVLAAAAVESIGRCFEIRRVA
jgi:pimeloyl-ACP methyl ester carboxylesterase